MLKDQSIPTQASEMEAAPPRCSVSISCAAVLGHQRITTQASEMEAAPACCSALQITWVLVASV